MMLVTSICMADSFWTNGTGPRVGYKGFVDGGFHGRPMSPYYYGAEITTTHGYQICPFVFVGAGAGLKVTPYPDVPSDKMIAIPIFGDLRITRDHKNTPFVDAKIGYAVGPNYGLYFKPTIGYRFDCKGNVGFNMGIGYGWEPASIEVWSFYGDYHNIRHESKGVLSITIGFDW